MKFLVGGRHFLHPRPRFSRSCVENALRDLKMREGCGSQMVYGGCWNSVGNLNRVTDQASGPCSSVCRALRDHTWMGILRWTLIPMLGRMSQERVIPVRFSVFLRSQAHPQISLRHKRFDGYMSDNTGLQYVSRPHFSGFLNCSRGITGLSTDSQDNDGLPVPPHGSHSTAGPTTQQDDGQLQDQPQAAEPKQGWIGGRFVQRARNTFKVTVGNLFA
jgi:hypothetical protein